jgi:hypothetical protein
MAINEVIPSLGTVPQTTDPTNFDTRADSLLGTELPAFRDAANVWAGEANALATTVNGNAVSVAANLVLTNADVVLTNADVVLAAASAAAADAASNATLWVSGTAYGSGVVTYSPIDLQSYRANTATSGTTDPSASSEWEGLAGSSSIARIARTSNTIISAANKTNFIDITSGTFSQTFSASSSLGAGWFFHIKNSGTGIITLDPNASETIDGLSSISLTSGESKIIQCDGSNLFTVIATERVGNQIISVHTANGFGSSSTKVRRFTTTLTSAGSDISYSDSSTLGGVFTINTDGIYAISARDRYSFAGGEVGITLNSTGLTTDPGSIAVSQLVAYSGGGSDGPIQVTRIIALSSGDVIRMQCPSFMDGTTANQTGLVIQKIGTL